MLLDIGIQKHGYPWTLININDFENKHDEASVVWPTRLHAIYHKEISFLKTLQDASGR